MAEKAPCCTLTNAELVAKAREWITSLCQTGGRSWSLRVPVDLNRDPDMIFEELCIRLSHGCPCHEPEPAKESRFVQVACWCERCELAANHGMATRMSLCPECGDKRCSRAEFHENQCDKAPDTQRTDPPITCRWWRDEYGNWCCACSDTMPDFTPWPATDPNGWHCPKCGKVIATKVHDKP